MILHVLYILSQFFPTLIRITLNFKSEIWTSNYNNIGVENISIKQICVAKVVVIILVHNFITKATKANKIYKTQQMQNIHMTKGQYFYKF